MLLIILLCGPGYSDIQPVAVSGIYGNANGFDRSVYSTEMLFMNPESSKFFYGVLLQRSSTENVKPECRNSCLVLLPRLP